MSGIKSIVFFENMITDTKKLFKIFMIIDDLVSIDIGKRFFDFQNIGDCKLHIHLC